MNSIFQCHVKGRLDAFCVSSQTELSPLGGIPREQFLISVEGEHSYSLSLLAPLTHALCTALTARVPTRPGLPSMAPT